MSQLYNGCITLSIFYMEQWSCAQGSVMLWLGHTLYIALRVSATNGQLVMHIFVDGTDNVLLMDIWNSHQRLRWSNLSQRMLWFANYAPLISTARLSRPCYPVNHFWVGRRLHDVFTQDQAMTSSEPNIRSKMKTTKTSKLLLECLLRCQDVPKTCLERPYM